MNYLHTIDSLVLASHRDKSSHVVWASLSHSSQKLTSLRETDGVVPVLQVWVRRNLLANFIYLIVDGLKEPIEGVIVGTGSNLYVRKPLCITFLIVYQL